MAETGPVDIDLANAPDYAAPLIWSYGLALMAWSRVETGIDHILMLTFEEAAVAGSKREIPNQWSAKCDLFIRRFTTIARLQTMAADAGALAPRLRNLGARRNQLIHGAAVGFAPGPPPTLHLLRNRFSGETVTSEAVQVDESQLDQFAALALALHADLRPFLLATAVS